MILDVGRDEIARLSGDGLGGSPFDHLAIGTDGTTPSSTNTALGNETNRVSTTTTVDGANNEATFEGTITFGATPSSVEEYGVVNAATGGTFLNRTTFAESLEVFWGDKLNLVVDVSLSPKTTTHTLASGSTASSATTDGGVEMVLNQIVGNSGGRVSVCALGKGNVAPSTSDSTLGNEVLNKELSRTDHITKTIKGPDDGLPTGTIQVGTKWTSQDAEYSNFQVDEVGVFDTTQNESGTLISRYVYATPLKFRTKNTYEVNYRFQIV
jgi:hypothetical protein